MSVRVRPLVNVEDLIDSVKKAGYGVSRGDKRHIINVGTVETKRRSYDNAQFVVVDGLCGQGLEYVHGVTSDWSGRLTDLSNRSTCARCLKKAGLPPEPKKRTCPTCRGTGKVDEQP